MVEIRKIRIKEEEFYKILYGPLDIKISFMLLNFYYWPNLKSRDLVFRAFDPRRLEIIIKEGTERTKDYVSKYDNPEIIYVTSLLKALQYAEEHFDKGEACIAVYNKNELEQTDFYSYKPKKSFKEALAGIVCLEKE